ncbi:unnamed protein product, partial [Rotaria magnacalcarata]
IPLSLDADDSQNMSTILNLLPDGEIGTQSISTLAGSPSFARSVVNTNILTLFNYNGSQIYVYSSLANDANAAVTPHKWIFYYVPIMAPMTEPNIIVGIVMEK